MLPKARCTGKRDESRGVEKFMLCHYYGTIEGTFLLDCSTLKLKMRNIAHKLSWDHVKWVVVTFVSMWVAVTSVTISFVFGSILKVISHKISCCIASFFLFNFF